MFESEAVRLREILLAQQGVSPLLNLGSSTGDFRTVAKPHIERELFAPLRAAGIEVVHSDLKQAEGVDIAGDILDPAMIATLRARGFKTVLLSNLLEHVRDRAAVTAACEAIVGPGGVILATVPGSYPFHADPIDTGYRPTPAQLAAAFTRSKPIQCEEVVGRTFREDIAARGSTILSELAQTAKFALIFPFRPKSARARLHRWRWLDRRYRVSVALVEVSGLDGRAT
jgi:SAM-dependent methyltransferase